MRNKHFILIYLFAAITTSLGVWPVDAIHICLAAGSERPAHTVQSSPDKPVEYNRLISESSPYLQQHATNPVNWYPWGPEAFEAAKRENKPIFLSVGYSTCHWCHVMEQESFSDGEVAGLLNRDFISIKVDKSLPWWKRP